LSGLGLAFGGVALTAEGNFDWAARLLLCVLIIDHLDGTLSRKLRVGDKIPEVSGETLDLVTDVIGLTFAPMFLFYRSGLFMEPWGLSISIVAVMVCSLKYGMKRRVLEQGYSLGASPVYFSLFLFYFLKLDPVWPTLYATLLTLLCILPIKYPITSIVTTHWKPGWQSITNYLSFLALPFALVWLDEGPSALYWILLANMLAQILIMPALLAARIIQPGFRRVY
jgi:phosphatidylserine synthase